MKSESSGKIFRLVLLCLLWPPSCLAQNSNISSSVTDDYEFSVRLQTALPDYDAVLSEDEEAVNEVKEDEEDEEKEDKDGRSKTADEEKFKMADNVDNFPTPGLKKHYATWMKRIRQSDYVKYKGDEKMYKKDEEEKEMDEKYNRIDEKDEVEEKMDDSNRLRAIAKMVRPKGSIPPRPKKLTNKCQCGESNNGRLRIVGGVETHKHHYPWMASIQQSTNRKHFCGASIITPVFLLTAAHCTHSLFPFELLVRVGDHDLTSKDVSRERSYEVKRIIQHPNYNPETTDSDIAILELYEPIPFTWRVSPICLTPPDLTFYNEEVKVMGWGKEKEKAKNGAPRLKHVTLTVVPMYKCRHNFKLNSDEVTANMLCADGGREDTCQGDSGGPLVWEDSKQATNYLIGLTSWGIGCGLPNYPGVYTKVSRFLEWIYRVTRTSTFCSSKNPKPKRKKIKRRKMKSGRKGGRKRHREGRKMWRKEEEEEEEEEGENMKRKNGGKIKKKKKGRTMKRRRKGKEGEKKRRRKGENKRRRKGGKMRKGRRKGDKKMRNWRRRGEKNMRKNGEKTERKRKKSGGKEEETNEIGCKKGNGEEETITKKLNSKNGAKMKTGKQMKVKSKIKKTKKAGKKRRMKKQENEIEEEGNETE